MPQVATAPLTSTTSAGTSSWRKDILEEMVPQARSVPTGYRVYDGIRKMAMQYRFKPNERINEVELAAAFGVSRSPVREALQRLVTEGLFTFQANRGFFCRGFDVEEILNLSDVRALLEERAVRLAAQKARDSELEDLAAWWRVVVERADSYSSAELTEKDEEFHVRIASLSGNPELFRMISGINARIHFVRQIEVEKHRRLSTTYTEHSAIAAAMLRRDAEAAAKMMVDHISLSVSDAVATVKEGLARIFMHPHSLSGPL